MRQIACPLCGASDHTFVCARTRDDVDYHVVRCAACGFHHVNPEPDEPELLAFYDQEYSGGHELTWHGFEDALNRRMIADLAGRGVQSLVDFGAGQGRFVHLARASGIRADGVEPSALNCTEARERYGITLSPVTVREYLAGRPHDIECITMLNVLEHLPAPLAVLRQAHESLRRGGLVAVVVPNVDFTLTLGRVRRTAGFRDPFMLESRRFTQQGFDPPIHLSSFSAAHLQAALERAGFHVESIGQAPVIRTASRAVYAAKLAVAAAGRAVQAVSGGRVIWGYSLYAVGRRD